MFSSALGSMLSRPLLVNHADCTVVMPTLTLENNRPDQPSPFRHMNLHCQLCLDMAAELGAVSDSEADKAQVAKRMQNAVVKWFEKLPAEYAVKAPETRWDRDFDWVVFQRRYLHLIGYMGLFSQLRPFVTRSSAKPMSELESSLRAAGVDSALGLIDVSWRLFESLVSVGAKFHYAIFCIFDAATVMCSAFLQDEARNLPQRENILEAIKKCMGMLAEVAPQSKTTAALYRILRGLLTKLPLNAREQGVIGTTKRVRHERRTPPSGSVLATKSPTVPSDARRKGKPEHRSSSASSESDSTLDSSNLQPRSESSESLPDSCGSLSAQASEAQSQRRSVAAANSVALADGLGSSNSFMPPVPLLPAYPATTGGFMPAVSAMSTAGYMATDGFPFQYNSELSPMDAVPFSQPGWQPSPATASGLGSNNVQVYQNGSLAGFETTAPEVLSYWGWQELGLGHPVSWGQVQDQGGIRQHPVGLPVGFNGGQVMANDCGASSSTEDMSHVSR
jgi:hypothetical protein